MKTARITAAFRDFNCKNRGPEWYRLRLNETGEWEYFAQGRMPKCDGSAGTRRVKLFGDVVTGDLVAQHARGGAIDTVYLVTETGELQELQFAVLGGKLHVTMPDGTVRFYPNPRR